VYTIGTAGLGLDVLFWVFCVFCMFYIARDSLIILCFWCIFSCFLSCQYSTSASDRTPGKTRLRNDLLGLCVERDVKLYSLTLKNWQWIKQDDVNV